MAYLSKDVLIAPATMNEAANIIPPVKRDKNTQIPILIVISQALLMPVRKEQIQSTNIESKMIPSETKIRKIETIKKFFIVLLYILQHLEVLEKSCSLSTSVL